MLINEVLQPDTFTDQCNSLVQGKTISSFFKSFQKGTLERNNSKMGKKKKKALKNRPKLFFPVE